MDVMESLCNNLGNSGIDATINPEKKGLLSQLSPFGAKSIGKITLRGKQIDEIELFGHYQKSSEKRFGAGARSSLEAVDVDYVLRGNIKDKKNILEANLNVKRTGLVHRKVVEMHWAGGALADKLNNDSTVTELLGQSLGQLSARDIEVKVDENAGAAIIHVRDDRQVIAHKLPPFQLYEKIADHIYALAGTQKNTQPLSPRQAVPEPPTAIHAQKAAAPSPVTKQAEPPVAIRTQKTTPPAPLIKQSEPPVAKEAATPAPISKQPEPLTVIHTQPAGVPCKKCGHQNPAGFQLCTNCGFLIGASTEARQGDIVCKKCGGVNASGARLCKKCGNNLEAVSPPAPLKKQPDPLMAIHTQKAKPKAPIRKQPKPLAATPPPPEGFPCSKCGYQNLADAIFCAGCGVKVKTVSRSMFCPKCGDPIAEGENFCDKCGKKLV